MKNFVQPGDSVTVVAAANVTSGSVVVMGQLFGIATHTALSGANLTLKLGSVFDLPKANAASMAMAVGANVFWDGTQATTSATSNTRLGVALVAASNTATSVRVRLNDSF